MRKQHTLLALCYAAMAFDAGNLKLSNSIHKTANDSMGNNPIYFPTRSQRVKNKIMRKRTGK